MGRRAEDREGEFAPAVISKSSAMQWARSLSSSLLPVNRLPLNQSMQLQRSALPRYSRSSSRNRNSAVAIDCMTFTRRRLTGYLTDYLCRAAAAPVAKRSIADLLLQLQTPVYLLYTNLVVSLCTIHYLCDLLFTDVFTLPLDHIATSIYRLCTRFYA